MFTLFEVSHPSEQQVSFTVVLNAFPSLNRNMKYVHFLYSCLVTLIFFAYAGMFLCPLLLLLMVNSQKAMKAESGLFINTNITNTKYDHVKTWSYLYKPYSVVFKHSLVYLLNHTQVWFRYYKVVLARPEEYKWLCNIISVLFALCHLTKLDRWVTANLI